MRGLRFLTLLACALTSAAQTTGARTDTQTYLNQQLLKIGAITKVDVVKEALKAGAKKHCRDQGGNTPLHLAAAKGNLGVVVELLEQRASVKKVNKKGWTPLHGAAFFGYKDVIEKLLEAGADSRTLTKDGKTAFSLTLEEQHSEASAVLAKHIHPGKPKKPEDDDDDDKDEL